MRSRSLAALTTLALAGCSLAYEAGRHQHVQRETFCAATAAVYCLGYEHCCPGVPANCEAMIEAGCRESAGPFLDDPAVSFDADEADAVLAELRAHAQACDAAAFTFTASSSDSVRRIYHGDRARGEPCSFASTSDVLSCELGLACNGTTCEPVRNRGDICMSHIECSGGLFCSPDGRCADLQAAGAPCNDDEQCRSATCVMTDAGRCAPVAVAFCI